MSNNLFRDASEQMRNRPFLSLKPHVAKKSEGGARFSMSSDVLCRHRVPIASMVIAIVIAVGSAPSMSAQTFGNISGHVSDTTGAAISQAALTLTNVATGAVRSTTTTPAGDYAFTAVPTRCTPSR
jgi:hypothetical protein